MDERTINELQEAQEAELLKLEHQLREEQRALWERYRQRRAELAKELGAALAVTRRAALSRDVAALVSASTAPLREWQLVSMLRSGGGPSRERWVLSREDREDLGARAREGGVVCRAVWTRRGDVLTFSVT